jgi:colicin import membrane protein
MKATGLQGRLTFPSHESFARYLALSALAHAVVVLGVLGGMWFSSPKYYKPSSYVVSLVDAPVTLQPSSSSGGGKQPAEAPAKPPERKTPPEEILQPPAKQQATAPPTPEAPEKKPKPVVVSEPAPEKKPKPVAVSEPAPEKKPKPVPKKPEPVPKKPEPAVAQQKPAKPAEPAAASAAKAQEAVKKLRQQEADKAQAAAQVEQAKRRLAALREQYATGVGEGSGSGTTGGLQDVRLRAYQDLIRGQIIEAWILPLSEAEAQKLQAVALLTVDRMGHITRLELLKPSGNVLFDESLLRAIKQAAPLPALPEDYVGEFLDVEMRFRVGDA